MHGEQQAAVGIGRLCRTQRRVGAVQNLSDRGGNRWFQRSPSGIGASVMGLDRSSATT